MKKSILGIMTLAVLTLGVSGAAQAGTILFHCGGGEYVKSLNGDTSKARKEAKKLGCEIKGTKSDSGAANVKIIGTVEG